MGRVSQLLDPAQTGREARTLEISLRQRIVGQDEAIETVVQSYQAYLAGMVSPSRPIANLLFLGPTGSGKTRIVEAAGETLAGDARAVIKIDCAEFQHSHEIAKLIGSPPGYLGHRETHPLLSQEVLNRHHTDTFKLSFVLFDEIEKASDSLWNLLLGILDKATLTLGDNRRVDFSRALIFMTSNLGAGEIGSILDPRIGFAPSDADSGSLRPVSRRVTDKITLAGVQAARHNFTPEFMNRIDRTVVFKPLGPSELCRILTIELDAVQQRVLSSGSSAFLFTLSEAAKQFLLREGVDLKYGARHLKRSIQRHLVTPLSNLLATAQVRTGDSVLVDFDTGLDGLTFYKDTSRPANPIAVSASAPAAPATGAAPSSTTAEESGGWFRNRNSKR